MSHPITLPARPSNLPLVPSFPTGGKSYSSSYSAPRPHIQPRRPAPLDTRRRRDHSSGSESDGPPSAPRALRVNGTSTPKALQSPVTSSSSHRRAKDEDKPLQSPAKSSSSYHRSREDLKSESSSRRRSEREREDDYDRPLKSSSSKTPLSATFSASSESSRRREGKDERDRERYYDDKPKSPSRAGRNGKDSVSSSAKGKGKEKEKERYRYSDDDEEPRRGQSSRSQRVERSPSLERDRKRRRESPEPKGRSRRREEEDAPRDRDRGKEEGGSKRSRASRFDVEELPSSSSSKRKLVIDGDEKGATDSPAEMNSKNDKHGQALAEGISSESIKSATTKSRPIGASSDHPRASGQGRNTSRSRSRTRAERSRSPRSPRYSRRDSYSRNARDREYSPERGGRRKWDRSPSPVRDRRRRDYSRSRSRSRSPVRGRDYDSRARANGVRRGDRMDVDRSLSRSSYSSWSGPGGSGESADGGRARRGSYMGGSSYRPGGYQGRRGSNARRYSDRDRSRPPSRGEIPFRDRDNYRPGGTESPKSTPEKVLVPVNYDPPPPPQPQGLDTVRSSISFQLKKPGDVPGPKTKANGVHPTQTVANGMLPPPPKQDLQQSAPPPAPPKANTPPPRSSSPPAPLDLPPPPPVEPPPDVMDIDTNEIPLPNLPVLVAPRNVASGGVAPASHFRDFSMNGLASTSATRVQEGEEEEEEEDMMIDADDVDEAPSSSRAWVKPAAFAHHIGRGNYLMVSEPSVSGRGMASVQRMDGMLGSGGAVDVADPRLHLRLACLAGLGSKVNETELLKVGRFEWDEHSVGSKPPPPPDGITITGLHHLTQTEAIKVAASRFGDVRDIVVKLSDIGQSLGICWVQFGERKGRPAAAEIAKSAMAKLQGTRLDPKHEERVKVMLDRMGLRAERAAVAEKRKRKDALALKSKPPSDPPKPVDPPKTMVPPAKTFAIPARPTTTAPPRPPPPPPPSSVPTARPPTEQIRQSIGRKPPPNRGRFNSIAAMHPPASLPPRPAQPTFDAGFLDKPFELKTSSQSRNISGGHARQPNGRTVGDDSDSSEDDRDDLKGVPLLVSPRQGLAKNRGNMLNLSPREAVTLNEKVAATIAKNGNPYLFIDKLCLPLNLDYEVILSHHLAPFTSRILYDTSGWYIIFEKPTETPRAATVIEDKKVDNHALRPEKRAAGAPPVAAPSTASRARPTAASITLSPIGKVLAKPRQTVKIPAARDPLVKATTVKHRTPAAQPPRNRAPSPAPSPESTTSSESLSPVPPSAISEKSASLSPPPKPMEVLPAVEVAFIKAPTPEIPVIEEAVAIVVEKEQVEVDKSEKEPVAPAKSKSHKRKAGGRKASTAQGPAKKKQKRVLSPTASPDPELGALLADAPVNSVVDAPVDLDGDIEMAEPEVTAPAVVAPPVVPAAEEPLSPAEDVPAASESTDTIVVKKPAAASIRKSHKKGANKAKKVKAEPVPVIPEPVEPIAMEPIVEAPAPVNPLNADDEDLYMMSLAIRLERDDNLPKLPEGPLEELETSPDDKHPTGCARTHGYYKVKEVEKSAYLPSRNKAAVEEEPVGVNAVTTSRSTRVNTRRLVQGMEQHKKATAAADTDVFQFNQLRTRKKQLKFSKSPIHDWGLYAMEAIPQGEMVIEYVGEVIRAQVADIREKWYEKIGIGSSYLFRVDDDAVVDATKKGNLGRLINHCCAPNCTAKIITINGDKKIVIYAKSNIEPGEEITYDYHFPLEQEKIVCLCGSSKCRGYLN